MALLSFRGIGAQLLVGWTSDPKVAEEAIRHAPTGGRTPLAHALREAARLLQGVRRGELLLLTDGRANVPLQPGSDPWQDALTAAQAFRGITTTVIDTETGQLRLGRAAQLAQSMGATLRRWEA